MKNILSPRRESKQVEVGNVMIGGNAPVTIQSMTKTRTENIAGTIAEIHRLEAAGCDLVRCAVPNKQAAQALQQIIPAVKIPVVADIHFNYRLALLAIEAGVHKIRINPGNIGKRDRIERVLNACCERHIPIRIGVNAGSLEQNILKKYGHPTPAAMVESALHHVRICEELNFDDLVISLKASDVIMMISAYRLLARRVSYPFHLGVTEAGPVWTGTIRSSIGIGTLLADGIGETIRVSLTGDPVEEVRVGKEILKSMGLRSNSITLISCPTCGRLETPDLLAIASELERKLSAIESRLTVAVMGCAVNGPGEAKEADLGVACGRNEALFFKKGKVLGKIKSSEIVNKILGEAATMAGQSRNSI